MPALPQGLLTVPIAHRGLHGVGVPENTLAAARAAIAAGYAIECDIQPAADGTPMVFHDAEMMRLTGQPGLVSDSDPASLAQARVLGSDQPIPTLAAFLGLVAGQVPLLVEIKDQDGACGHDIGTLHLRVAEALADYAGPVAVMSFNPHVVAGFHRAAPRIAVGLTSCAFPEADWPAIRPARRVELAALADFDRSGASFVSHDHTDLANPRIDALRAQGVPILCWTIRSAEQERAARAVAHNITFEGYAPAL